VQNSQFELLTLVEGPMVASDIGCVRGFGLVHNSLINDD
jgi:hypothetical protein